MTGYEIHDQESDGNNTPRQPGECECVDGQRRCPEADRLWNAANAVYYSHGYDAWMKALSPYRAHYEAKA